MATLFSTQSNSECFLNPFENIAGTTIQSFWQRCVNINLDTLKWAEEHNWQEITTLTLVHVLKHLLQA